MTKDISVLFIKENQHKTYALTRLNVQTFSKQVRSETDQNQKASLLHAKKKVRI